jgi:hypothetical protein
VFESDLSDLDAAATLTAVEVNEHTLVEAEVQRLRLALHWADLHAGDMVDPEGLPGRQRPRRPGGAGTPTIAEFCTAELAASLQMSAGSALALIGDALDLRHRLPRSWTAAQAGQVPAYQARRVADATRHLTVEQARQVDDQIAPALGRVPWGRLTTLLQAAVYAADPAAAEAAAAAEAQKRFVRLSRNTEHGLKWVIARVAAGDALWVKATVDRLADILRLEGDHDPVDIRRAKAFGLLAQPAQALTLLHRHATDPDHTNGPEPDENAEPDHDAEPDPSTGSGHDHSGRDGLQLVPPAYDPARARPRTVVYVHLNEAALTAGRGVARVEDLGPTMLSSLRILLGEHCLIQLKPVIDLNDPPAPVDCYEIPKRMREDLQLRYPADVFPYAAGVTRRVDLDHTIPYRPPDHGGPSGQTAIAKLGPLNRFQHRVRTFGGWAVRQPEPGQWLWRSPHGRIYLVNTTGTHPLGHGHLAATIWRATKHLPTESAEPPEAVDTPDHHTADLYWRQPVQLVLAS